MKPESIVTVCLLFCTFLVLFPSCHLSFGGKTVTVVSYNVLNLFDDVDDGTEYDEYDPGTGRWGTDEYLEKLAAVSEVIRKAVPGGPDILALQEIEGQRVLEDLSGEYLRTSGYTWKIAAESYGGAVRVVLLSRYPVTAVRNHRIDFPHHPPLRSVLEITIDVDGTDLHIFNNHWKSKSGGAEVTEPLRIAAAQLVRSKAEFILRAYPDAEILIVGDLNESVDEFHRVGKAYPTALFPSSSTENPGVQLTGIQVETDLLHSPAGCCTFFSPWEEANLPGSYEYNGEWESIDHIMMSAGLLDDEGLTYKSFRVFDDPLIMDADGFPASSRYSDHLPIIMELVNNRSPVNPPAVAEKDRDG